MVKFTIFLYLVITKMRPPITE